MCICSHKDSNPQTLYLPDIHHLSQIIPINKKIYSVKCKGQLAVVSPIRNYFSYLWQDKF